jgi:hypothetical protein
MLDNLIVPQHFMKPESSLPHLLCSPPYVPNLSQINPIQVHPISCKSILILSFQLYLNLAGALFPFKKLLLNLKDTYSRDGDTNMGLQQSMKQIY